MIAYEQKFTSKGAQTIVRLEGKIIGHILKVKNGYQYKVKNSKHRGQVFPHIHLVKQSLEEK